MIDTTRRDAIRDEIQAIHDSMPAGPGRGKKMREMRDIIRAINSAQTDKVVGRVLLEWYGVKR